MAGLLVAAASQGGQPPPPERFDLECIGFKGAVLLDGKEQPNGEIPGRVRMRLDLERSLWCNGDCRYPRPLTIEGRAITFLTGKTAPDGKWVDGGAAYRDNGLLIWFATPAAMTGTNPPAFTLRLQYRCARADFSGIPTQGF